MRRVVINARRARVGRISSRRCERTQQHLSFFVDERPRRDLGLQHAFVRADVEHFRNGALLRLPNGRELARGDLRHFARGIVEIAEDAAFSRTHAHARREQLVLDAVRAEVAFLRRMGVRIDEQLIVRTRDHARPASDAAVPMEIDDAVAPLEERIGRTDLRAGRFVALIAEDREKKTSGGGESTVLDCFHPTAVHPHRNVVLGLTGDRASVTTDAFSKIDGEPVVGHKSRL